MRYDSIKTGDGATLSFTLDPLPNPFTSARFILRRVTAAGLDVPAINRLVDSYNAVTGVAELIVAPAELTVPGWYRGEVEVLPGPVTYPTSGWFSLRVVPGLG